jgi:hypothetical protein
VYKQHPRTSRENPQKNFRKVTFFQSSKPTTQNTITHHESPQLHHKKPSQKTHLFQKPPSKKPEKSQKKSLADARDFFRKKSKIF